MTAANLGPYISPLSGTEKIIIDNSGGSLNTPSSTSNFSTALDIANLGADFYNVMNPAYGASGKGLIDLNCSMSSTSSPNVVTTTTIPGPFTLAMIGRNITVSQAISAGPGGSGVGTVTGFINSNNIIVSFNCLNTVSGAKAMIYVQDDTPAIQAALSAAEAAGGGTVYIPAGTYFVQPQSATALWCFQITNSNIRILGDGADITNLIFCVYPMLDPVTNWQIVNGLLLRGNGFVIGDILGANTQSFNNIIFQEFTFNGNTTYDSVTSFPANKTTGVGWDITHKCIFAHLAASASSYTVSNTRILNVHFTSWRGEIVYLSSTTPAELGTLYVYDSEIDTGPECISVSTESYIKRNHIYKTSSHAFDNSVDSRQEYTDNYIHSTGLNGINIYTLVAIADGQWFIENNFFSLCQGSAITCIWPYNLYIRKNIMIDCGWSSQSGTSIGVTANNGQSGKGVTITDNEIVANAHNILYGMKLVLAGNGTMDNVTFDRNTMGITSLGQSNGVTFGAAMLVNPAITNTRIVQPYFTNGASGAYTTTPSNCYEKLLTGTSLTHVVTLKPGVSGLYEVGTYFRVITATTDVTIGITYNDATGAQTVAVLALTSEIVGSYQIAPFVIAAATGTSIVLNYTAGTANQVYVTAAIKQLI